MITGRRAEKQDQASLTAVPPIHSGSSPNQPVTLTPGLWPVPAASYMVSAEPLGTAAMRTIPLAAGQVAVWNCGSAFAPP